jgi:hypothetical protein
MKILEEIVLGKLTSISEEVIKGMLGVRKEYLRRGLECGSLIREVENYEDRIGRLEIENEELTNTIIT